MRANAENPKIATKYSVHRHPRYELEMKPPINGARKGPQNTVREKAVIARPLLLLSYMSEKTAATTVKGQAPKKPAKNLHIITV